jgi:hypothetical protein
MAFRVSHHRADPWQPPDKDRDDEEPVRFDKKRRK